MFCPTKTTFFAFKIFGLLSRMFCAVGREYLKSNINYSFLQTEREKERKKERNTKKLDRSKERNMCK